MVRHIPPTPRYGNAFLTLSNQMEVLDLSQPKMQKVEQQMKPLMHTMEHHQLMLMPLIAQVILKLLQKEKERMVDQVQ